MLAAPHPAAGVHHPLQRHPQADDPHLAAGGDRRAIRRSPATSTKYLDESSELYQALHGNNQMSFGIDLARTPLQAMSDGLGTAWPYLLLVVGIAVTSYVQQRQIQGRNSGAINPQMQMISRGCADHVRVLLAELPGRPRRLLVHLRDVADRAAVHHRQAHLHRGDQGPSRAGQGSATRPSPVPPGTGSPVRAVSSTSSSAAPSPTSRRAVTVTASPPRRSRDRQGRCRQVAYDKGVPGKTPAGGTAPTGDGGSAAARPTGRVTTPGSRPRPAASARSGSRGFEMEWGRDRRQDRRRGADLALDTPGRRRAGRRDRGARGAPAGLLQAAWTGAGAGQGPPGPGSTEGRASGSPEAPRGWRSIGARWHR